MPQTTAGLSAAPVLNLMVKVCCPAFISRWQISLKSGIGIEPLGSFRKSFPMPAVSLKKIVAHCDTLLRTREINDYDGAVNGLQVENRGDVSRIAATVDASVTTVQMAIDMRANLLLVHHGLFWSKRQPWTGVHYELLRLLLDNDVAVYSSHLPLDMHPTLGNNAQLCAALGLRN